MLLVKKIRKLGYITGEQLKISGNSIVPRVPSYCDDSTIMSEFEVWKESYYLNFNIPAKYKIRCIKCGYDLELDFEEYYIIRKLIKANYKFETGKISEDEHINRISLIKDKINMRT